jgi:hypothetical protein
VKASELARILNSLTDDPDIVTGEEWLPERLVNVHQTDNYLFCEFDNAPEEGEGDEEERGFVTHEIELIQRYIMQIFLEKASLNHKRDELLALILYAHEQSPSNVVEILEKLIDSEDRQNN